MQPFETLQITPGAPLNDKQTPLTVTVPAKNLYAHWARKFLQKPVIIVDKGVGFFKTGVKRGL